MIHTLFFIAMVPLLLFLVKNLVELSIQLNTQTAHKQRLKQLRLELEKIDKDTYESIENMTEPVVTKIFPLIQNWLPSLKVDRKDQLKIDLKTAGWDDTFSPDTFIALGLMLKAVGLILLLFGAMFGGVILVLSCMFGGVFAFGLDFWFKSSVDGARTALFKDFPDFIRIVSGYLSADMNIVEAITDSIKYVGDGWRPILQQLVIDCKMRGVDYGFSQMKNNVDIFEVTEFVSLVRLTLEMGGNIREGFEQQADKIAEIQKNLMVIKIGKRKTLSSVLQGPLLLCNLVVLALPTFGNIASFLGTM